MHRTFGLAASLIALFLCLTLTHAQDKVCKNAANPAFIAEIKTSTGICSYSGLLSLRESASIFFWYFETTNTRLLTEDTPVIVYLNGDVGASSIVNIFSENGPLKLKTDFAVDKAFEASKQTDFPLIDSGNILYLDFPEGVGFSTSSEIKSKKTLSRTELSQDFLSTIQKFTEKFSDTKNLKWYIATETYSAHLAVDFLADAIKRKEAPSDSFKHDFRGILLVNPLLDSVRQMSSVDDLAGPLGFVAPEQMDLYSVLMKRCEVNQDECQKVNDYLRLVSGSINVYDFREYADRISNDYLAAPYTDEISRIDGFFNKTDNEKYLRELLKLNTSSNAPLWRYRVPEYADLLSKQFRVSVAGTLKSLLPKAKVLISFTQFQLKFNYRGGLEILPNLVSNSSNLTRRIWKMTFNGASRSVGFFYETDNLTFVLASELGSQYSPKVKLQLLKNFVKSEPIDIFCKDEKCNITASLLNFAGNCSGKGNWVENMSSCNCTAGYEDADCSVVLADLPEGRDVSLKPREWVFYKRNIDSDKLLSFELERPENLDVYIAYNRIAKEHDFDLQNVYFSKNTTKKRIAVQKQDKSAVYISVRNNNYDASLSFKAKVDLLNPEPEFMDDIKRPVVIVGIVFIIVGLLIIIINIVMCCKNRSSGGLLGGRL